MEYHPGWLYDKMYSSKDYASEARYLHRLIQKLHPRAQTLLDAGLSVAFDPTGVTGRGLYTGRLEPG